MKGVSIGVQKVAGGRVELTVKPHIRDMEVEYAGFGKVQNVVVPDGKVVLFRLVKPDGTTSDWFPALAQAPDNIRGGFDVGMKL